MTAHRCFFCRQQLGVEPCRYCLRYTCATCHHGPDHLRKCPDTKRRET
jgi:hypothetical protein